MNTEAHPFPPTVYSLFLSGNDTIKIAKMRRLEEHDVVRLLTQERSASKGLPVETRPSPYLRSSVKKWLAGLHPGIGRRGL